MATLEQKNISTAFSGLAKQAYVAIGVGTIGLVVFESLRRVKRNTKNVQLAKPASELDSEDYFMNGYLYQSRSFIPFRPVKQHSEWPLAWIWDAIKLRSTDLALRSGIDAAAYVIFIQGCWFFSMSQLLVTFPVVFAIHLVYSPNTYPDDDINRASLSALVTVEANVSKLWVHVLLCWYMSLCFVITIFYVGRKILRLRRMVLQDMAQRREFQAGHDPHFFGWRHRTLLISNIPTEMRTEERLRTYLTHLLHSPGVQASARADPGGIKSAVEKEAAPTQAVENVDAQYPPFDQVKSEDVDESITHIELVRRTADVHDLYKKRQEAHHELEKAHVELAQNVLEAVQEHRDQQAVPDQEKADPRFLEMVKLSKAFASYLDPLHRNEKSVWEVLRGLPPESLDPFQPTFRLTRLFKGQRVGASDYWLTKFNFLTAMLEERRAQPPSDFKPTPTAFVTFHSAAQARRLLQKVPHHPDRPWACRLEKAPDPRDLEWDKLAASSFRGDVVRSFVVQTAIWAFIIAWVIPVGAILSLVSLNNLASIIPALENYLSKNPNSKELLSSLVPTVLLAVLLFLVPTMLIQISNRFQHFITVSKLHHEVLCRYHAFLLIDVIIIFCAGSTALESLFVEPGKLLAADSLVNRVASAFPAGAPFFVGWQIIVTGIHPFFELMLFGFPLINQIGVSLASTPRKRFEQAVPRIVNIYSLLPLQLLVLSILHIYALLNPLIICFGALYWTITLIVFKRSFGWYYWRRHYELNGNLVFIRFMRYSIDGLMLAQIVLIALLWVSDFTSGGAAIIPLLILTFFFKLVATRAFSAFSAMLDVEEADVVAEAPALHTRQLESVRVPIAPAFLKKMWPFNKFVIRVSVNRSKREKKRRAAIEKAQKRELQKPPQAQKSFLPDRIRTSNLSAPQVTAKDPEARPILQRSSSDLGSPVHTSEDGHLLSGSPIKQQARQQIVRDMNASVVAHPPVMRDDRTVFCAQYDNPYMTKPLTTHLWLPRDPLLPVNLNDSVDYYGSALVSSKGGDGQLGNWHKDGGGVDVLAESPTEAVSLVEELGDQPDRMRSGSVGTELSARTGSLADIGSQGMARSESSESFVAEAHSASASPTANRKQATRSILTVQTPDSPTQQRRASVVSQPLHFTGSEQIDTAETLGDQAVTRSKTLSPEKSKRRRNSAGTRKTTQATSPRRAGRRSTVTSHDYAPTTDSRVERRKAASSNPPGQSVHTNSLALHGQASTSHESVTSAGNWKIGTSKAVSQSAALREAVMDEYRQETADKNKSGSDKQGPDEAERKEEKSADRSWLGSHFRSRNVVDVADSPEPSEEGQ